MDIFSRDSSAMRSIKNTIRRTIEGLVLSGGLVLLTGCPSGGGATKPAPVAPVLPTPGEGGNTRGSGEPKIIVSDSPLPVTLNENGPETMVTLFKGQGGAVPTACSVNSLSMVTVTTACACWEGVCRVGVQPLPKVFGAGSFEFRLFGQSGEKTISSNIGKASVEVLEVTLSIHSGDNLGGTVGENLPEPIVVKVQNSNKEPVSGVKIFWNIEKKSGDELLGEDVTGKISCTKKTDKQGLAKCIWTLGTSVFASSQKVDAFAFYSSEEIYEKTLGVSFSAFTNPDKITQLSFWSFHHKLPNNQGVPTLYRGPASPTWSSTPEKIEKAGVTLGKESNGGGVWVFAQDKYGNPTTVRDSGIDVTLSLGDTKPDAADLKGVLTGKMINTNLGDVLGISHAGRVQGVAKFKNAILNKAGKYTLNTSTVDVDGVSSFTYDDPFNVSPGDAFKLAFTTQPGGGVVETVWTQQPVVAVWDVFGNLVTLSAAEISLAVGTGPGAVSGATVLSASKGVSIFSGLSIDKTSTGYRLTASSSGLASATSSAFDIGANAQSITPIDFVTLNENGPEASVPLPYTGTGTPISCEVSLPFMVTVTTCTCSAEGTCNGGVQPVPKSVGEGFFYFKLSDSKGPLGTWKMGVKVLAVTMSIHAGDGQTGAVGENLSEPIVVQVQNSKNEPVSGVKIFWDVEKKNDTWDQERIGKVSSCTDKTDIGGLAQCTWTLGTEAATGSQKVNVSAFYDSTYKKALKGSFSATVKPDRVAQLSFWHSHWRISGRGVIRSYQGPSPTWEPFPSRLETAGVPLGPRPDGLWVFAQDKYGNPTTVGQGGVDVTLSFGGTKPDGAVFLPGGVLTKKMVDINLKDIGINKIQGVAKFEGIKVNKAGEYKLDASGPAILNLVSDTSTDPFNVAPAVASVLVFTSQPGGGPAKAVWAEQPVVTIQDVFGNIVPSSAKIDLAIGTNPSVGGAEVLSGVASRRATNGVLTFSRLRIDKVGTGYTLTASIDGFTSATSSAFDIVAAPTP